MRYYPVYLDIKDKNCLVIGGGSVGTRKVKTLLDCGAKVTVVTKRASKEISTLHKEKKIQLKIKQYEASDLKEMFLVIATANNQAVNLRVSEDAKQQKVICNIADYPKGCDFILPSIVNRGDLIIAISSSGKSPAFAKKLRKELEKKFGDEYAQLLKLLGSIRKKLLSNAHEPEVHKPLFENLINVGLLEMIKEHDLNSINSLLFQVLGKGYKYNNLMDAD